MRRITLASSERVIPTSPVPLTSAIMAESVILLMCI